MFYLRKDMVLAKNTVVFLRKTFVFLYPKTLKPYLFETLWPSPMTYLDVDQPADMENLCFTYGKQGFASKTLVFLRKTNVLLQKHMFYLRKIWFCFKNICFPEENQCFVSKTYVLLKENIVLAEKHQFSLGKPMFCCKNLCFT